MSTCTLRSLDQKAVLVELTINKRLVPMRGIASYKSNFGASNHLQIRVDDPASSFEFILAERDWDGVVESCELPGCDYRIRLDAGCLAGLN